MKNFLTKTGVDYMAMEKKKNRQMHHLQGGKSILRAFVDASYTNCKLIRRSRTGFIIFINSVPVYYFSKNQGSCEVSTFGSEFVAMKQCCEYIRGLRYKLRMMGVPVNNPTFIYGDN